MTQLTLITHEKKSIIRDGYWLKEAEKKMEDMNKLWRNFLW